MIVMNERRWAEQILETGELGEKSGSAVFVLAKYFYQAEGLKPKAIAEKLDKLLAQLIPDYNALRWEPILEKAAQHAKRRPMVEVDEIVVTQGELDGIDSLRSSRLRRLAFTMVVLARYFNTIHSKNNNWVNVELKELFQMACISATVEEQAAMYRELIDCGFIAYSRKVGNNNAQVLILDGSEPVLSVQDLRNVGHVYQLYCGEPYFPCEKCGILVRQNRNRTKKYCADCARKPSLKMRKYRCIDCNAEVFVVARNSWSCRCPSCQDRARKLKYQRYNEKRRHGMTTSLPWDDAPSTSL